MHKRVRALLGGLCCASAVGLSACGAVGDGNSITGLRIVPGNGADGDTVAQSYLCRTTQLTMLGSFESGSDGNYTSRGTWSSSDPSVVEISNGDVEVPGIEDSFYAAGVLVPHTVGTATITADFVGLTATIEVDVTDSGGFVLSPAAVRVATTTQQQLSLTTTEDGEEVDVTGEARYSIDGEDEDDEDLTDNVALVSSTSGLVVSQLEGDVVVNAVLPLCPDITMSSAVHVQDPEALVIAYGEGFGDELVDGTTEYFSVFADFGDGPEQDVSGQIPMVASDTEILRFSGSSGSRNLASAVEPSADPVDVTATLSYGDDEDTEEDDPTFTVTSNALPVTVIDPALETVTVTPSEATIEGLGTVELRATGTFEGGYEQDITRHVAWTSSDTSMATVVSGVTRTAGTVSSRVSDGGAVTIEATDEDATVQQTDTATITIDPEP